MTTDVSPKQQNAVRIFPRRAFVAAALSALVAGGAVGLGILGGLDQPSSDQFAFSRGTAFAAGEEARLRGFLTEALADDRIMVRITGHSGVTGDAGANQTLSEDRAATAADIARGLGIANGRILAIGVGGDAPLPKEDGESDRGYQSRLARVHVALQLRR